MGAFSGMDTQRRDTMRSFRADDELWAAAKAVAKSRHETVSDVLRRSLIGYVRRHQAQLAQPEQGQGERRRAG